MPIRAPFDTQDDRTARDQQTIGWVSKAKETVTPINGRVHLRKAPMKTFLTLISMRGCLDPALLARVPAYAQMALPFRHMPYRSETWHAPSNRIALFA